MIHISIQIMMNTTCEETTSLCPKFQSTICFHCNRRLCFEHITEHNRMMSHVNNLSNEVKITYQQIREESDNRKDIYNTILTAFNQWRSEQIEEIDRVYHDHLQDIESQREDLINAETNLFEQLEQHAQRPLEPLQREERFDMHLINHIQQLNKRIRAENKCLKWKLATNLPPPISPSMPSIRSGHTSSEDLQRGRGLKRLVQLFENIASIEQARKDIIVYLKKLGGQFELPIVVCSYLTAWNKKTKLHEKVFLLSEHITIIQKYLNKGKTPADILIGIQAFFYNETTTDNRNEMMTFLLQFFLNHRCIDRNQILNWYNKDIHGYKGFSLAKQLAESFIKSLTTTNQTVEETKVKQEPMAII